MIKLSIEFTEKNDLFKEDGKGVFALVIPDSLDEHVVALKGKFSIADLFTIFDSTFQAIVPRLKAAGISSDEIYDIVTDMLFEVLKTEYIHS